MKRVLGAVLITAVLSLGAGATVAQTHRTVSQDATATAAPIVWPDNATHFTFWTFVDRHATWWLKRAQQWNAANPDRPIALDPSVIEYTQMHDNLAAAFVSGSGAPNIVDIEIGKFANFTKGTVHLLDMTAEVAPYVPDLVATRLAPYKAGGKQYAVDYHLGAVLAFYNKDLMDKAGLDPSLIKTWDDYQTAGQALQLAEPGVTFSAIDTNGPIPIRSLRSVLIPTHAARTALRILRRAILAGRAVLARPGRA